MTLCDKYSYEFTDILRLLFIIRLFVLPISSQLQWPSLFTPLAIFAVWRMLSCSIRRPSLLSRPLFREKCCFVDTPQVFGWLGAKRS